MIVPAAYILWLKAPLSLLLTRFCFRRKDAGCPLADMVTPEKLHHYRKMYPG